jgi:hypothetical protein
MADDRFKLCNVVVSRVSSNSCDDYFTFEFRDEARRVIRVEMTGQQLAQALTSRVTSARYEEFVVGQRKGEARG